MPAKSPIRLGDDTRLIETLGYFPGKGAIRAARHLDRIERSAAELGFRFERGNAAALIETHARGSGPRRIRITLGFDGDLDGSSAPFEPTAPDRTWSIAIAAPRLDSRDPLLAHKTTQRAIHEAARQQFPTTINEVLLLNEAGEVCEGTITNIFIASPAGQLLTPPLRCGLLGGILREELLAEGRAIEQVLLPADLSSAPILVGNSMRGLIRARLVEG